MTSQHLPIRGLSQTEEAKVLAMLQSIGTNPTDFLVTLLKTMARTGVVPLLVNPDEKVSVSIKKELAPIGSLGIPYPHQCHFNHEPNEETKKYLLLSDEEKGYETFPSFESWLADMNTTIKQP